MKAGNVGDADAVCFVARGVPDDGYPAPPLAPDCDLYRRSGACHLQPFLANEAVDLLLVKAVLFIVSSCRSQFA